MAFLVLVTACGAEQNQRAMLETRDQVFQAAGVALPNDLRHTFVHSPDTAGCGDSWSLAQDYRPRDFGLPAEPVPVETAATVASFLAEQGRDVLRYEQTGSESGTVIRRAVAWSAPREAGFIISASNGYQFRVETVESCPEPVPIGPPEMPIDFEVVERFGEGNEPGCGGTREACNE